MNHLTRKQIALIHVACKELRITEDDRHTIQESVAGSRSLTRMTEAGWRDLVRHLEARGFKSPMMEAGSSQFIADSKKPLITKIYALWYTLAGTYYVPGKERAALRGFLRKRFRVDHENFLTPEQAIKVIEAIKAIKKRRGAGEKGGQDERGKG